MPHTRHTTHSKMPLNITFSIDGSAPVSPRVATANAIMNHYFNYSVWDDIPKDFPVQNSSTETIKNYFKDMWTAQRQMFLNLEDETEDDPNVDIGETPNRIEGLFHIDNTWTYMVYDLDTTVKLEIDWCLVHNITGTILHDN